MKKIKNMNKISLIAIILLVVFAIITSFCYTYITNSSKFKQQMYLSTIDKINRFKEAYNSGNASSSETQQQPVYDNGRDALLNAYKEFQGLNDFYIEMTGKIFADAEIVTYNLELQSKITKVNGATQSEVSVYCATSNAQCSSTLTEFSGNTVKLTDTNKVSKVNGKLVADFSGCKAYTITLDEYVASRGIKPGELFYTINDRTVTDTNNFYIQRDLDGNIQKYRTNILLHPTLSTVNYTKMLSNIMKGSKNYKFSNCRGILELDSNAKLRCLTTSETYSLDYNIFGDAFWDVVCTSTMTFNIYI